MASWNSGDPEGTEKLASFYLPALAMAAVGLPSFYLALICGKDGRFVLVWLAAMVMAGVAIRAYCTHTEGVVALLVAGVNLLLPLTMALVGLWGHIPELAAQGGMLALFAAIAWLAYGIVAETSGSMLIPHRPYTVTKVRVTSAHIESERRDPPGVRRLPGVSLIALAAIGGCLIFLLGEGMGSEMGNISPLPFAIPFFLIIFALFSLGNLIKTVHFAPGRAVRITADVAPRWLRLLAVTLLVAGLLATLLPKKPLTALGEMFRRIAAIPLFEDTRPPRTNSKPEPPGKITIPRNTPPRAEPPRNQPGRDDHHSSPSPQPGGQGAPRANPTNPSPNGQGDKRPNAPGQKPGEKQGEKPGSGGKTGPEGNGPSTPGLPGMNSGNPGAQPGNPRIPPVGPTSPRLDPRGQPGGEPNLRIPPPNDPWLPKPGAQGGAGAQGNKPGPRGDAPDGQGGADNGAPKSLPQGNNGDGGKVDDGAGQPPSPWHNPYDPFDSPILNPWKSLPGFNRQNPFLPPHSPGMPPKPDASPNAPGGGDAPLPRSHERPPGASPDAPGGNNSPRTAPDQPGVSPGVPGVNPGSPNPHSTGNGGAARPSWPRLNKERPKPPDPIKPKFPWWLVAVGCGVGLALVALGLWTWRRRSKEDSAPPMAASPRTWFDPREREIARYMRENDPFADPFKEGDERSPAEICFEVYRSVTAYLWLLGFERKSTQTDLDFAHWLSQNSSLPGKAIKSVMKGCSRAHFSPAPLTREEMAAIQRAYDALVSAILDAAPAETLNSKKRSYRRKLAERETGSALTRLTATPSN